MLMATHSSEDVISMQPSCVATSPRLLGCTPQPSSANEIQLPINVEVCASVKSVKYILKYIHKGGDCADVDIRENTVHHDEILQYLNARYVGPHQEVFRIMKYKFHDRSHTIIHLALHLPLQQNIFFQEGQDQQVLHRNLNTH